MPILTCGHCKRPFKTPSSTRKNCSRACSSAAKVRTFTQPDGWHFYDDQWWYHWNGTRKRGHIRQCRWCGTAFPTLNSKPKKHCSLGCSSRRVTPGEIREAGDGYLAEYVTEDDPFLIPMRRGLSMSVLQHRLVMARHLGRPLRSDEQVHHINGDRADNRLENLQLRQTHHGNGRVACCGDCGSSNIEFREI